MSVTFSRSIPVLRIFDQRKALEFYCDYLGMTVDWKHQFDPESPLYLQVSRNGLTFHLSEHHGDACPGSTVYVWMSGIDEFHRELASKGYRFLRPGLEHTFYGTKCIDVTDPFGNRFRFNEDLSGRADQQQQQ